MRTILLLLVSFISSSSFAYKEGGGGDLCEDRIKIIRDDIKHWIKNGGALSLILPNSISADIYSNSMLEQIAHAKVRCVGKENENESDPVTFKGTPKFCRFDFGLNGNQITCDYIKFQASKEADQYVLVHHEYAGLAGIETPNGDDSNYGVSNQISGYLVDTVVKKLAIKPNINESMTSAMKECTEKVDKKGFDRFVGDILKKTYMPLLSDFFKKSTESIQFTFGEVSMEHLSYWNLKDWNSLSPSAKGLSFKSFAVPIIIQHKNGANETLLLEGPGQSVFINIVGDYLGNVTDCGVYFWNTAGNMERFDYPTIRLTNPGTGLEPFNSGKQNSTVFELLKNKFFSIEK